MIRKVYRIPSAGNTNHLKLVEESISSPKADEVQIQIHAIGLNFADIFALTGLYSATPKGSFIPGLEFSGEIIEVGSNVVSYQKGDKVMGVTRFGAYASHINSLTDFIHPLPQDWSYAEGSAFIAQALTAYYALLPLGNLKKEQTVLIHSAAGGVGVQANRIAKHFGAYTIGSIGSPSKIPFLKEEGYDAWIVRSPSFSKDLEASLKGRELNLVLECIGGRIFEESYRALGSGGRIVTYGSANFTPTGSNPDWLSVAWNYLFRPKLDPLQMTTENKSVMAFNLIWMWDKKEELNAMLTELLNLGLPPQKIGRIFPFQEAHSALEFFRSGASIGKIVLELN
ncbi:MAG: zinc-binding dehydrogenase [Leptospiraceae bacterium]|nr:zinc-binding dehydrogenase [Leptospiraceae bacterium]MCP5512610.1 zinc-binding dehydrogenase [Leptospiraceae bacterium]